MTHPHPKRNFVPSAVLMKSSLKTLNTARQNSSRAAVSVSTARPINTAYPRPIVNSARPVSNVFNRAHSHDRRPFNKFTTNKNSNFNEKVNTVRGNVTTVGPRTVVSNNKGNEANVVKALACWVWRPKQKVLDHGNPHQDLKDKGVIDSGCSRHMTGNKSYLTDYEDIDRGLGNSKGGKITGKCKIRTGKLDFEDVYFVKKLKFNLFSVSQMCDKKNSVLFTGTECIVLSPDFKLTDESHVLLKVPRKDNMYNVDLKNVDPQGGLTCFFAKIKLVKSFDSHNMVAYLEKSEDNADFAEIVDFLNASPIRYALTVSPTVYVSYIEQFWSTAKIKTVNNETQIRAKVDGKTIVITESSVRRDLYFNDEDGITCLTNTEIFENLQLMGYEKLSDKLTFLKPFFSPQWKYLIHTILQCLSSKSTAWNEFGTNIASAVICLAKKQKFNFSKLIFDAVFNDEYDTPSHTKKVFANMRRQGKDFSRTVTPLFATMLIQPQADVGEDETVHEERGDSMERAATTATSLDAEQGSGDRPTQTRFERLSKLSNDPPLSKVNTLGSGEDSMKLQELMDLCTKLSERVLALENIKTGQDLEITNLKKRVKKLEKKKKSRTTQLKRSTAKVTTASVPSDVDVSAASPIRPVDDSITKDKGKGIMQEHEKPVKVKGKYQIEYDADVAQRLHLTPPNLYRSGTNSLELDEEVRLEREREEEASNAALIKEWDSIEARIDADAQLAERLQAEEREQMSVEERARLLMEIIAARKKFFAAKRAEEQRNKPPTKAEQRKKMCIYMKHMTGYKDKNFKGKSFDAIKQMFDKAYKQKIEDDAEKAELKACLEIVPGDDSAVNIESLATKYPIVDWKTHILVEDKMYYHIIKADGSTKYYKIFSAMLDDFDRQDVLDLYMLVKERFESTSPEGYDRLLWGDFITLFEPSKEDEIWKAQQDYTLISWRLYDSCGVHLLLMDTGITIHMLVEKKYPLTQEMLSRMLSRRLEVDHECEMAFELLRFIKSQYKKYKNVWIHPPELQLLVGVSAAAQD
ncbi:hypothetical protein Tco_0593122 [Tanacetum coccineum]